MSMNYQWLRKDGSVLKARVQAACFMDADYEYKNFQDKPKYFRFMFPTYKVKTKQALSKKYILSLYEVYDFDKYMGEIDWKEGSITFDLTTVPGHRIFAICTLIRMLDEYSEHVFVAWQILNNKKFFSDLSAQAKLVLMHWLACKGEADGHKIYPMQCVKSLCKEFIAYKPVFKKANEGYYHTGDGTPPNDGFDLPYKEYPVIRSVSLNISYSPKGYEIKDTSFVDFLKEKALSNTPLEKLHEWNKKLGLLS